MSYPKQLFRGDKYRVVWGSEEHYQVKQEGWGDQKDPDAEPRVESDESYEASEAILAGRSGETSDFGAAVYATASKRRGRPPKVQTISEVA